MRVRLVALVLALTGLVASFAPGSAGAQDYTRISGEGSSWAAGAIESMRANVEQFGIKVDYAATGSTSGRKNFLLGTVDFAASDIPFQFQPEDGSAPDNPKKGSYAYIPVTAGGTSFMYNLKINGQRVTNLRLSGENVAKIFTGVITSWDDPALKADNPGLALPARKVVPVVRSDGSGSTAQFTRWMISQHGGLWDSYCDRSGRAPACGLTSFYPTIPGMIAQAQDFGVAAYVSANYAEGTIGYVNYSYAIDKNFPVAKVLNAAGYYTEPTPKNVSVSLLKARINTDENSDLYLTQQLDDVYTDADRRNYPLSSYSYFILPTVVGGNFNEDKGKTLGAFAYYAMCQAQQQSESLGYSPMPINLVEASFDQIRKIPGVVVQNINIAKCDNPTFSTDGKNTLVETAPFPQECDKRGPTQCTTGTGGVKSVATPPSGTAGGTTGGGTGGATGTGSTGGATGGTGGTTGGTAGTTGGTADGGTGREVCDPDTGVCQSGTALDLGGDGSTEQLAQGGVQTALLKGSDGWSTSQTLMVLIFVLTLGLVLAPAATWRFLSKQERE